MDNPALSGSTKGKVKAALCATGVMLMLNMASSVEAQEKAKAEFVFGYLVKALPEVDVRDATAAMKLYVEEFATKLGIPSDSVIYQDTELMLRDVEAGRVDLFTLGAIDYLRAKNGLPVAPGLIGHRSGKFKQKRLLLVRNRGPGANLNDLKGKKLAILKGDDVGSLFLNVLLLREGQPEMPYFFSSTTEKSAPSQALLAVFFDQADACIVEESAFETASELNPQVSEKLSILAESPELVAMVAFFRKDYNKELMHKLVDFSLTLPGDPRGRQILTLFKYEGLRPFNMSELDTTRAMLDEYDRLRAAKSPLPKRGPVQKWAWSHFDAPVPRMRSNGAKRTEHGQLKRQES